MARSFLVAAALLVAAPTFAQANEEPVAAEAATPDVDARLIGEWTLVEVGDLGELSRYGAEIEGMTCTFSADGAGEVHIEVLQDLDTHAERAAFQFVTEDGQIVPEGAPAVDYAVLGTDLLELRDARGLVVRLTRTGG